MMWCNFLLNVLAIFMVKNFIFMQLYIFFPQEKV